MEFHRSEWSKLATKIKEEKDLTKAIDQAETSLIAATEFLHQDIRVLGDKILPYAAHLLLLSVFFEHCPTPTLEQKKDLTKWFWGSSLAGWFTGFNTTKTNSAVKEMRALAQKTTDLSKISISYEARPFPERVDMRSSRSRALLIFMAQRRPLDPQTGKPLELAPILHVRKHLPKIFPKSSSKSSPGNHIYLEASAGESIKDRLLSIPEKHLDQVLESHAIPMEAYQALKNNEPEKFIEIRANYLEEIEQSFIGSLGIIPAKRGFGNADIDTD